MNNKSTWEESLKTRSSSTFAALKSAQAPDLILHSPTDIGVMRNGGKRGSRFSPQTLNALFAKMIAPANARLWEQLQVSQEAQERTDFVKAQLSSSTAIERAIKQTGTKLKHVLHLGGGHDHIYPLVSAFARLNPKEEIIIVNIDAHLDSRVDHHKHSGTPFRQLSKQLGQRLHLYQVGIHSYANAQGNYSDMGTMEVAPNRNLKNPADWLIEKLSNHRQGQLILSLDCDGLDQSFMPAVSAPNHDGLSSKEMYEVLKVCQSFWKSSKLVPTFGLYEYNPVFDNIGVTAGRYLTSLIYQFLYP